MKKILLFSSNNNNNILGNNQLVFVKVERILFSVTVFNAYKSYSYLVRLIFVQLL